MDPRALLARIMEQRRVAGVRAVLDTYGRAAGGLLANGLAFSSLFAAIPTIFLLLGVAGWINAGDPTIREGVRNALVTAVPPLAAVVDESIRALGDGAVFTSTLGVIGVVWTVSQLFGAIDVAFARIFSDEPERHVLRRTVRGFVVVGLIAAVVAAIVGTVALLAAFDTLRGTQASLARDALALLSAPPSLLAVACIAVILGYRLLPTRPPRWRALIMPALVVGAILVVLSQAFTFLVPRLVGVAELAGSLASGFVTLAWLSFSYQALLLGAAWVHVRDVRIRETPAGSAPLEGAATPAEAGAGGQ